MSKRIGLTDKITTGGVVDQGVAEEFRCIIRGGLLGSDVAAGVVGPAGLGNQIVCI